MYPLEGNEEASENGAVIAARLVRIARSRGRAGCSMSPDDAKAGETHEWLDQAMEDLASAPTRETGLRDEIGNRKPETGGARWGGAPR